MATHAFASEVAPDSAPQAQAESKKTQTARAEQGRRPSSVPAWRADSDLWYFDGARGNASHPTEATLRAPTAGAGRYDWRVLEGHDKVELGGGNERSRAEARDDNTVRVRSRGGSAGTDDVRIGVTHHDASGGVTHGESSLGVRNPVGLRVSTSSPAPASFPDTDDFGPAVGGTKQPVKPKQDEDGTGATETAAPDATPKSLRHTGTNHSAHATWMYITHENYETLDDTGATMSGYDVNEKFTTAPTNDAADCDWRRGPAGGLHVGGTTWFDNMGGEVSSRKPAPQNPGSPLGNTKVQHWNQEWYVGSTTSGSGTKVQTNLFQKYQDHAAHENITSPP